MLIDKNKYLHAVLKPLSSYCIACLFEGHLAHKLYLQSSIFKYESISEQGCLKGNNVEGEGTLKQSSWRTKKKGFHPYFKEQDRLRESLFICILPHGTKET